MATATLGDAELLFGGCRRCGKEVLTYVEFRAGGEARRCLHCDGPIDTVRPASTSEVEAAGYTLIEARACGNGGGCGQGCGAVRTAPTPGAGDD